MFMMVLGFAAQVGGTAWLAGGNTGGSHGVGLGLLVAGSAWLIVGAIQSAGDHIVRRLQNAEPEA